MARVAPPSVVVVSVPMVTAIGFMPAALTCATAWMNWASMVPRLALLAALLMPSCRMPKVAPPLMVCITRSEWPVKSSSRLDDCETFT